MCPGGDAGTERIGAAGAGRPATTDRRAGGKPLSIEGTRLHAAGSQTWVFVISGPVPPSHFPLFDILPRLLISVTVSGLVTFLLALFLTSAHQHVARAAARKLAAR